MWFYYPMINQHRYLPQLVSIGVQKISDRHKCLVHTPPPNCVRSSAEMICSKPGARTANERVNTSPPIASTTQIHRHAIRSVPHSTHAHNRASWPMLWRTHPPRHGEHVIAMPMTFYTPVSFRPRRLRLGSHMTTAVERGTCTISPRDRRDSCSR